MGTTPRTHRVDMTHDLFMTCRCSATELKISAVAPAVASRVVCYCSGCQAFAHRFAPEILDEWGGTERLQVSPATIRFTRGEDLVRCVQQTPKGALRWMAGCCDADLGLTLRDSRVPFVGLDAHRIDATRLLSPFDDIVGPIRARVNGDFDSKHKRAMKADVQSLFGMLVHLAPLTFRWWRQGDHRRSPFFADGVPVTTVEKLYDELPVRSLAGCR